MTTKLGRMVTYFDGLLPIKSHYVWLRGPARLRDDLKQLYIYYHDAYDNKT